jgi:hypothetical protein
MTKNQKVCSKCGIEKDITDFHKDKQKSDGYCTWCKVCKIKNSNNYYKINNKKINEKAKVWRENHLQLHKDRAKRYYKKNQLLIRIQRKEKAKKYPWLSHYQKAKQRCEDKNNNRYYCYGNRGIQFLMNVNDFKFLWIRDKAYEMKKPHIHRINNDGNYCIENCRFIEASEHTILHNKK